MQEDPQVGRGNANLLTDLLGLQAIEGAQGEDLGLPLREGTEAGPDLLPEFGILGQRRRIPGPRLRWPDPMVIGCIPVLAVVVDWEGVDIAGAYRYPDAINDLMAQDAEQPGALGAVAAEAPLRLESGQEGLLDRILRIGALAQTGQGIAEQAVRMGIAPLVGVGAGNPGCRVGIHQDSQQSRCRLERQMLDHRGSTG